MAVKQIGENRDFDTREFMIDSAEDVVNLPTNVGWGSVALCASDNTLYTLTSEKEWKLLGFDAE